MCKTTEGVILVSVSISLVMHGFHNNTGWSSSSDVSGRMKHWTEANTGVHLFILSVLPYSIGSYVRSRV